MEGLDLAPGHCSIAVGAARAPDTVFVLACCPAPASRYSGAGRAILDPAWNPLEWRRPSCPQSILDTVDVTGVKAERVIISLSLGQVLSILKLELAYLRNPV